MCGGVGTGKIMLMDLFHVMIVINVLVELVYKKYIYIYFDTEEEKMQHLKMIFLTINKKIGGCEIKDSDKVWANMPKYEPKYELSMS